MRWSKIAKQILKLVVLLVSFERFLPSSRVNGFHPQKLVLIIEK